jgi:hypothetical protein
VLKVVEYIQPNGYIKDFEKSNVCAFRKVNSRTRVFVSNLKNCARVNFSVEKVGNSKEILKSCNILKH